MNLRRGRASVAVLLLGVSLGVNVAAGAADADTPAGQSASDTNDQSKLETVVVTGIRASLGKSLEEKQNAEIVVDSINAIELGAFPTTTSQTRCATSPGSPSRAPPGVRACMSACAGLARNTTS